MVHSLTDPAFITIADQPVLRHAAILCFQANRHKIANKKGGLTPSHKSVLANSHRVVEPAPVSPMNMEQK